MEPRGLVENRLAVSTTRAGFLVGMSGRWIRQAIADGRLASVKFGRRRLVLVEDLCRLLEANRHKVSTR